MGPLASLLRSPPRLAGSQVIDYALLRREVRAQLEHDNEVFGRNLDEDRVLIEKWKSLYSLSEYIYQDAQGRTRNVLFDLDGDGAFDGVTAEERAQGLVEDAFPTDSRYHLDSDSDGVADQVDRFPKDPNRFLDLEALPAQVTFENNHLVLHTPIELYSNDIPGEELKEILVRWEGATNTFISNHSDQGALLEWRIHLDMLPTDLKKPQDMPVRVARPPENPDEVGNFGGSWRYKWFSDLEPWAVVHESGHVLGLEDGYAKVTDTLMQSLQKMFLTKDRDFMAVHGWQAEPIIYMGDIKMLIAGS